MTDVSGPTSGPEPESAGSAPPRSSSRRPYHGSCHCGAVRYLAFLALPPPLTAQNTDPKLWRSSGQQRIYRCSCTMCHKAGLLHLRVLSPPDDFALLAPLDPLTALGDYTCGTGRVHWLFCRVCAVRCFALMGDGEVVEDGALEVPSLKGVVRPQGVFWDGGAEGEAEETKTVRRFWRPKKEGWVEGKGSHYLTVNAHSIDAGQDGFDLREWTEGKAVAYMDGLELGSTTRDVTFARPHPGGSY